MISDRWSVYVHPSSLHEGKLWEFHSLHTGEKELVVLGDFGTPPQSSELDILRKEKLCALVPSNQFTNISTRSPQGTRCLDNIWVSRSLKKIVSGEFWTGDVPVSGLHFVVSGLTWHCCLSDYGSIFPKNVSVQDAWNSFLCSNCLEYYHWQVYYIEVFVRSTSEYNNFMYNTLMHCVCSNNIPGMQSYVPADFPSLCVFPLQATAW